jgi:hypothetical protein
MIYFVENLDIHQVWGKNGADYYYCYKSMNIRTGQVYDDEEGFWLRKQDCFTDIEDALSNLFEDISKEKQKVADIDKWYTDWINK